MLSAWLDHVDSNSKKRIARKLSEWLLRKPTEDPSKLHEDLNQLKLDMGGMSRMGAWTKDDQIFSSLIEGAIDKTISKLCENPKLLKDLTAPYAACVESSNHNITEMIDKLSKIAKDLLISFPSTGNGSAPQAHRRSTAPSGSHAVGPSSSAGSFDPSKIICLVHRELSKCSRNTAGTCLYSHSLRSGRLCTDPEYIKTGICAQFKTCFDTHPWDSKTHGAIPIVPKGGRLGAQRLYLDIAAGKTCTVTPGLNRSAMGIGELSTTGEAPSINGITEREPGFEDTEELSEAEFLNPSGRVGRGEQSMAQQTLQADRHFALLEDISENDSEFDAAVFDEDLSDDSIHTSGDSSALGTETEGATGTEEHTETGNVTETATDGSMAEGISEASDEPWGTSDSTFDPESTESSEELVSDADMDSCEKETNNPRDTTSILEGKGWSRDRIKTWQSEYTSTVCAMAKSHAAINILPEGMDLSSGPEPSVLMMLDDGNFKHLVGRNAMHLAANLQDIEPYPVQSASGHIVWLNQTCDLVMDHCQFLGCLVNPHHDVTLLSEGWLHLAEGWEFLNNRSGKLITTPDGYKQMAYRNGVIFYLPSEFVPETEPNLAQYMGEFDQERALSRGYSNSDMQAMLSMAVTRAKAPESNARDGHSVTPEDSETKPTTKCQKTLIGRPALLNRTR